MGYSPNLLIHRDVPTQVDEVWVSDITYVPLRGGRFGYLSVLMDLYSRRIVGSISRTIVDESGGRIWFDSQPGSGSVFRFTLPRFLLEESSS